MTRDVAPTRSRTRRLATGLASAVGSLLVSLLLAEVVYRAAVFGTDGFRPAVMNSMVVTVDRPMVRDSGDPELRYRLQPNLDMVRIGVPFRTNAHGMRDEPAALEKAEGTYRIAVIGDSFTMGTGVAIEDVWHTKLEGMLAEHLDRPVECLNFGVGGYSLLDYAATCERVVDAFGPDEVIVGLCFNDQFARGDDRAGRYVAPSRVPGMLRLHWLSALRTRVHFWSAGRSEPVGRDGTYAERREHVTANFARLARHCEERSRPLLLVYLNFERTKTSGIAAKLFTDAAQELGIDCVDLTERIGRHAPDDLRLRVDDPHPSKLTHNLFARALFRTWRERRDGEG